MNRISYVFDQIPRTLLILCAFSFSGCGNKGPELGYVTGIVTLDGEPVRNAAVTFFPQETSQGTSSAGTTNDQGEYELSFTFRTKGVLLGTHDVKIEKPSYTESELAELKAAGKNVGDLKKVPRKYAQRGALTAEVKPGSQVINLELTSQ